MFSEILGSNHNIMVENILILDDMLVHLAVHMLIFIPIYKLVGGFNPSEKYESRRIIAYIMENKKCSKPPTNKPIYYQCDLTIFFSLQASH
jgi:hypothetical protein